MHKYIDLSILGALFKIAIGTLFMIFSVAFFIASINQAAAATLQNNVTVTGENITLGDVYADVEKNADFVLAPAPKPGVTLTWDARTINRITKAFDLPAVNASTQVSIRRIATIITSDMLKDAIKSSLKEQGVEGQYDLEFLNAQSSDIILPQHVSADLEVMNASYNPSRETFSATLKTADNQTHHMTGIIHPMIEVPVLKMTARRGDTIGRNDITTLAIREDYVTEDMIVAKDALVGMAPRKVIRAKSPVSLSDLDKPIMVKRGELVTMQLQHGPIELSALAKALENGTDGDVIRLINIDSKRTIEGVVTGQRTAKVLF